MQEGIKLRQEGMGDLNGAPRKVGELWWIKSGGICSSGAAILVKYGDLVDRAFYVRVIQTQRCFFNHIHVDRHGHIAKFNTVVKWVNNFKRTGERDPELQEVVTERYRPRKTSKVCAQFVRFYIGTCIFIPIS